MTSVYFYALWANAAVGVAGGIGVFRKNRFQAVGPLLGASFLIMAVWLVCFAQYYRSQTNAQALLWAKWTLFAAIINYPSFFHGLCALVDKQKRWRWLILASYATTLFFVVLLLQGHLIDGVRRDMPYMDHYINYNRTWYPFLGLHITFWQLMGIGIVISSARKETGYKRTQLVYFIIAWFTEFLTTNSIILPLEYKISIPPFGFFVLPVNMAVLAYVLSKSRLADFNVVISRILLYTVTMVVVVGISLLSVGGILVLSPSFMNQEQVIFTVILVLSIGLVLTITLPRLLPRAERMMQERMFGGRYGYQDTLAELVKELGHLSDIDQLLQKAASTVHSQMQLSRVLILMQDSLSGDYRLQAESGLPSDASTEDLMLQDHAAIADWLRKSNDTLVRDELVRNEPAVVANAIQGELDRLASSVCVPMIVDNQLVGMVCLGTKVNNDMFFVSDLKVLGTLTTEIGLAVRYHRMEDQIFRKNKLIELGTIAAGVAHEIRNPLASIRTFAQLLPDKMDDPEFKNDFSKLVLKDVDRITKVVESMLAFARPSQVAIAEHQVVGLVDEAVLLVQSRLKSKRVELTKQFHEDAVLRVDRQQILQVLVNLVNNAVDALPEHGKIRVSTGIRALEGGFGDNGNQKFAVIEVMDNGPGIPTAVRNRVFDPFFTTKKEGTGLGLSISQKIARDHGGIITVSSIEGKGTTFQVNLPVV